MGPLLDVRDLVVGYSEVPILRGVSMELGPQEVVAVIGPNGAGKSTLIKAVFGLLKPIEGSVFFEGRDITGQAPEHIVSLGMSYVPQVSNVFPTLTVRENLEMGAYILNYGPAGILGSWLAAARTALARRLHAPRREHFYSTEHMSSAAIEQRVSEIAELFPALRDRLRDRTGNLSGGQQQMVAIARALMLRPKVLLIDEPSAGLAPKLVGAVFDRIAAINETGTAIVLVEQNARKALELADRGYVLEAGHNRLVDRADRILTNPDIGRLFLGGTSGSADEKKAGEPA